MGEKSSEIGHLNETLAQNYAHISHLEGVVGEKEAALNNIYSSHGWKALAVYYRVRNKIFPINTKRRLFTKLVFNAITNPKDLAGNITKTNLKKFFNYFRTVDPAIIEEKIGRKVLSKSEIALVALGQVEIEVRAIRSPALRRAPTARCTRTCSLHRATINTTTNTVGEEETLWRFRAGFISQRSDIATPASTLLPPAGASNEAGLARLERHGGDIWLLVS
jgi:hypothetical protein